MLNNDKQFEALNKAMKILQIDEEYGLAVEGKWFNHLPIYNETHLNFVTYDHPQRINCCFLKVKPKEFDQFESNLFTTSSR